MTRFVFPKGHPREKFTGELADVKFVAGAAEVPAQDAEKYALILVPYHGAAPEDSEEFAELSALYEGVAEAPNAAAKAKRFEKNWDVRVKGIMEAAEEEQGGAPSTPPAS